MNDKKRKKKKFHTPTASWRKSKNCKKDHVVLRIFFIRCSGVNDSEELKKKKKIIFIIERETSARNAKAHATQLQKL